MRTPKAITAPRPTRPAPRNRQPSTATRLAAEALGLQVRLVRIRRGWTIQELGARAGISPETVAKLEAGTGSVTLNHVLEVCWLLGLEVAGVADLPATERKLVALRADLAAGAKRARKPVVKAPDDDF